MLFIIMTMKHVADNDQLFRVINLYLCNQPLHIFFKDRLRNGDACFTKMPGLAKMEIRKDKDFFFFPKNTAIC